MDSRARILRKPYQFQDEGKICPTAMKLPTDLYAPVLGVATSLRSLIYPPMVSNVIRKPAGTAVRRLYSFLLTGGIFKRTPRSPAVSTCTSINNVSVPRSTIAASTCPLLSESTFLASCTYETSTSLSANILSSFCRPLEKLTDVGGMESIANGMAMSNIPGVWRTSASLLWSM